MSASRIVELSGPDDVAGWLNAASRLLAAEEPPEKVVFTIDGQPSDLFGNDAAALPASGRAAIPEAIGALAENALLHRDPERFALLYRLAWRSLSEPRLAEFLADRDVARLHDLARAVRRDKHKMTAFVRFRAITAPDGDDVFIAWFEPTHHIVAATAPFFVRRFTAMRWSILTPEASTHWDRTSLTIGPGASRADAPSGDKLEDAWRTYYAAIFNPARLKVKAMTAEMPRKYWRNLPEASLIAPLVRAAASRTASMIAAPATIPSRRIAPTPPSSPVAVPSIDPGLDTIAAIAAAVGACRRCPLWRGATQSVPGEGPRQARLMVVGEQPGDQEDLAGRAFIGPAGKVFDAALARVGIERSEVYVTNAVKHFKFLPRGKRRIHQNPSASEIDVCRWWLDHERRVVKPRLVVVMGASAARGVLGRSAGVNATRGKVIAMTDGTAVLVTVHPSYLLRIREEDRKRVEWNAYLADLRVARDYLAGGQSEMGGNGVDQR